jgi:hypothetical protein
LSERRDGLANVGMVTAVSTDHARAAELSRLFIEALNAHDVDTLAGLGSDDVEFHNPGGGRSLHGREGLERLVLAAASAGVYLVRRGQETVSSDHGTLRVTVPVFELMGGTRFRGTAMFEVGDGKIIGFEASSELLHD